MSKKDWQQLQAYRALGLTPEEITAAVTTAAMITQETLCQAEQKKLGLGFCPGKGLCPIGTGYLQAAKKAGNAHLLEAEIADCEALAQEYPAVTVRALAAEINAWDEAHPEEEAK